jgi:hypothetical protein
MRKHWEDLEEEEEEEEEMDKDELEDGIELVDIRCFNHSRSIAQKHICPLTKQA